MNFKDHFSGHAGDYSLYRPSYPAALYKWISDSCPGHECAWDCATGNGQAAAGLAQHFKRVKATDASAEQISSASPIDRVHYCIARAEESGLEPASVDLVTVAQALHWFNLERFYAEVDRVLKPGGLLAVWTYKLPKISSNIDALIWRLYEDITGPYWPPERAIVDAEYRSLPFPFDEIEPPRLSMTCDWTLAQYTGYLGTWSAVRRYFRETRQQPLDLISGELEQAWGEPTTRRLVKWPLIVRAGYTMNK